MTRSDRESIAKGSLVALRPLRPEDVDDSYVAWMNDPDVTRYLESRFVTHTAKDLRDYVEQQNARADTLFLAIVRVSDGRHVGNVKIGPLDPHHGTADLGLLIGDPDSRGQGLGTETIRLAAEVAFAELGARKLNAGCYSDNVASANAFKRAGWRTEGLRPSQFLLDDGQVQDELQFGVTLDQHRETR